MDLLLKYHGLDWFSNACYVLYAWHTAKSPARAQWFAVTGSVANIGMGIMGVSVANVVAAVLFLCLYLRAVLVLERTRKQWG